MDASRPIEWRSNVVGQEDICTPFPDIAVHVVQAKGIWRKTRDRDWSAAVIIGTF
jgi:hypothetical protein